MPIKKLWGGRFSTEADPYFKSFNDSLPFDRELLAADIQGSLAYARALARAGVITSSEARRLDRALRELLAEHRANPDLLLKSRVEDVHTYVEQALEKKIGAVALKLHAGRSRNDQVATDLRLYLREKADVLETALTRLMEVIVKRASLSIRNILPGYTHLQRAQPVVFAHYLLAYGEMLLRDRERLRQARARANFCPLGSGALSGSVYSIDRRALARDLGFDGITQNSMDAVSDRDFVLDFLFFASVVLMHLSRLSEDLILYASSEFGFIRLDDRVASGSSIMPQKKNPDALELIRGKSGRVYGSLMSMLTVMKGLPMTYNKDLQEDKEGAFDALRTTEACLRMMALVLENLELVPERMAKATRRGFLNATELADYLAAKGLPFRKAHELVGKIVLQTSRQDRTLEELSLDEYRRFSHLFERDLYACLKLGRAVARRIQVGGTSPSAVRSALKAFMRRIRS